MHSVLRGGCQMAQCKQLIRAKVYCLFDGLWMSHPLSLPLYLRGLFLILITSCLCTLAHSDEFNTQQSADGAAATGLHLNCAVHCSEPPFTSTSTPQKRAIGAGGGSLFFFLSLLSFINFSWKRHLPCGSSVFITFLLDDSDRRKHWSWKTNKQNLSIPVRAARTTQ